MLKKSAAKHLHVSHSELLNPSKKSLHLEFKQFISPPDEFLPCSCMFRNGAVCVEAIILGLFNYWLASATGWAKAQYTKSK